jgi:hypothetical protein
VEEHLEAARAQGQKAVFYTSADPIARTNGVCLLGLYLVLQVRSTLALAVACGHPAVAGHVLGRAWGED